MESSPQESEVWRVCDSMDLENGPSDNGRVVIAKVELTTGDL